jgi:hypothetical protein
VFKEMFENWKEEDEVNDEHEEDYREPTWISQERRYGNLSRQ